MSNTNESKFFEISEVLYNADPADTCCVENNLTDEYDEEAFAILDIFVKDATISVERIKILFDERFDGHFSEEKIEKVFPTIKRILNPHK